MENSSKASTKPPSDNTVKQFIPYSFLTKKPFDDLEIIAKDNVVLYCSRGWLFQLSDFFDTLLRGAFREADATSISLECDSKILVLIFQCAYYLQHGSDFLEKNFFSKIENEEDLCDFLSTSHLYQLLFVKNFADKYFSDKDRIKKFFSMNLIQTVQLFEMESMNKTIHRLLDPHIYCESDYAAANTPLSNITDLKKLIDALDFETMDCSLLNFFGKYWNVFDYCFDKWISYHLDVTSEQLRTINKLNGYLGNVVNIHITSLIQTISKCTNAQEYKIDFYEKILLKDYKITYNKEEEQEGEQEQEEELEEENMLAWEQQTAHYDFSDSSQE